LLALALASGCSIETDTATERHRLSTANSAVAVHLGATLSQYDIVSANEVDDRRAGQVYYAAIVRRKSTGDLKKLILDEYGSPLVPRQALLDTFAQQWKARGPVGKRLYARLLSAQGIEAGTTLYHVVVGYKVPFVPKPATAFVKGVADKQIEASRAQHRANRIAAISGPRARVEQLIWKLGGIIETSPQDMAFVAAAIPGSALLSLAANPATAGTDIDGIELAVPADTIKPLAQYCGLSGRPPLEDLFWATDDMEVKEQFHAVGVSGNGVKVGILEHGPPPYAVPNLAPFAYLSGYTLKESAPVFGCDITGDGMTCPGTNCVWGCSCQDGKCYSAHATGVASSIGSVRHADSGEHNFAWKSHLYHSSSPTYPDTLAWMVGQGVSVISHSETIAYSDAVNDLVRNDYVTFVQAAGNQNGCGPNGEYVCYNGNDVSVGGYYPVDIEFMDFNYPGACATDDEVCTGKLDKWKNDPTNLGQHYARSPYVYKNLVTDIEKPDVMAGARAGAVVSR